MFWSFWIYVHWLSRETHSTNRAITAKTAPTGKILVGIVDIATRQQAERAAVGIQGGVNFSLLQKKKKNSNSYSICTGVLSRGVKQSLRAFDVSPPFGADIKNEWSYTSVPTIRLHSVDGDNFVFHWRSLVEVTFCISRRIMSTHFLILLQ